VRLGVGLIGKVIMYVTVSECASVCGPYRQSNNVCDCVCACESGVSVS
jgi:hypothetical protein